MADRSPRARSSIWTDRPHILQKEIKATSEAARRLTRGSRNAELYVNMCDENCEWRMCFLKEQIDISDRASISEVSVFTLLNAQ